MPSLTLAQPGMCFMSISEISTELKDVRGQWGPYCFMQTSSVPAAGLQFGHQISHLVAQLWILARPHLYWSNQWKEEKKQTFFEVNLPHLIFPESHWERQNHYLRLEKWSSEKLDNGLHYTYLIISQLELEFRSVYSLSAVWQRPLVSTNICVLFLFPGKELDYIFLDSLTQLW